MLLPWEAYRQGISGLCEGNHNQFYLIIVILPLTNTARYTLMISEVGFEPFTVKGNVSLAVVDKRKE